MAAVGLYSTNSSVNQVWPSGRTLLTEAIITHAETILAQQPASSIMRLTPSQLTGRIAAAILARPPGITTPVTLDTNPDGSSPDRDNFEAFITAVLQSSSTQPPTDPGTVADLTHVLNQAWAHPDEITERDVKTFAINRFGDDSPGILHTVNGWLYGAGILGNPPAPGTPRHTRIHHATTNAAATTVTGATPNYTAATRQIHPTPAPYTLTVTTRAIHANWPPTTNSHHHGGQQQHRDGQHQRHPGGERHEYRGCGGPDGGVRVRWGGVGAHHRNVLNSVLDSAG